MQSKVQYTNSSVLAIKILIHANSSVLHIYIYIFFKRGNDSFGHAFFVYHVIVTWPLCHHMLLPCEFFLGGFCFVCLPRTCEPCVIQLVGNSQSILAF